MLNDLTIKDLSDLIYEALSMIEDDGKNQTETVLQPLTAASKFPCRVIGTPLESVNRTEEAIPLRKTFQVEIEHWNSEQRKAMEMASKTDNILREKNFIRTDTSPITLDETIEKYKLITKYEVRWNALTNSFELIR